ncbi:MAG: ATP-binding cassette domain-containing protein, partial [Verrucomicrobiota bacterium]
VLTGRDGGIGLWAEVSEAELALATSCLAAVEAESLALREWRHLSQGEKQRVLIARALVREPKLLILDEPCAGLDPAARERLLRFIERLTQRSEGPSILLVTHHVEEIAKGFTHLLLLQRGRVAASGPIETTLTKDLLSELYEIPLHLSLRSGRYYMEFTADSEKV